LRSATGHHAGRPRPPANEGDGIKMATTMFFDETIKDKKEERSLDVEFGRSSFYGGENLIYINVWDVSLILDEPTGRKLSQAMFELASYLGYARDFDDRLRDP
jgi:hypothetical protein